MARDRMTFDDDDDRFRPKPAPSAEPEMLTLLRAAVPESSWFFLGHLQHVAEHLSRSGLAIVPAADVVTKEEREILSAMADASKGSLLSHIANHPGIAIADACRAELARRAAAAEAAKEKVTKFEDKATERMQMEAEEYISAISRLYNGYDVCYSKFVKELEHCVNRCYDEKMDIHDLEYLAAVCIALRRETVLKAKRFV